MAVFLLIIVTLTKINKYYNKCFVHCQLTLELMLSNETYCKVLPKFIFEKKTLSLCLPSLS